MEQKKITIINITSEIPSLKYLEFINPEDFIKNRGKAEYIKLENSKLWVGFFNDFHHITAVDVFKKSDKYNIECWRPYGNIIDKPYTKYFEGILHKVFPSRDLKIWRTGYWHWSDMMLKELELRLNSKEKILLHIHDGHTNFITNLILKISKYNIPIIYQHRGGWYNYFDFIYRRRNPISLITYLKQKQVLRYISYYLSGSIFEYRFLKDKLKMENVCYYMDGVDFDYFTPGDKIEARKKLNLPLDKKIILNVGRFDTPGGVDLLLRIYKKIKETRNDIELLLVGGYSYNECYNEAKNAGAILVERIPEESLLDYYRAADVYALPIKEYLFRNFGGIGTATIQALACGLPVVSYNILNVPGSDDEIEKIGKIFDTDLELYNNILYILDNEGLYKDCREVAKKYYEKNTVIDSLLLKYKEIINQYYPEKGMQLSG